MINPLDFYKTYTMYDGMRFVIISLLIIGLVMAHAYYFTKSRRVQIVNVQAWITLEVVYILTALVFTKLFEITIDVSVQGVYFSILLVQALNLLILTDYVVSELKQKSFDIDHVTRKHFEFTLNLGILILLVVIAGVIFVSGNFVWSLVLFATSTTVILAITHLIVRMQLKEPFTKPKK